MQFGHLGIALAIASLDPRPETFLVVGAAQFLPNADSLIIRAGWARPDFHGTWSHSLLFCGAVGALAVALFGPWLGGLALASIVAHVLADLPTDTGLPLLLPFSRRRWSLNLWKNTGRSEEHTSELQSPCNLVCRLLLEKKKKNTSKKMSHLKA